MTCLVPEISRRSSNDLDDGIRNDLDTTRTATTCPAPKCELRLRIDHRTMSQAMG
jgi:hypothetical protein